MQLTYDYLRSLLGELDDLMGLLQAQDHTGIRHVAHRAKGTSGTYGLGTIAEKFTQLEEATGGHQQGEIPGLIATVRRLVEAEMEKLYPRIAPSRRDEKRGIDGGA